VTRGNLLSLAAAWGHRRGLVEREGAMHAEQMEKNRRQRQSGSLEHGEVRKKSIRNL
jgi:hypothetical protein